MKKENRTEKKKKKETVQCTKMPRQTLLSLSLSLSFSVSWLSFCRRKAECPSNLKRSLSSLLQVTLLAYCLAEGASLTADGAKGRGGVATPIAGFARPTPSSNLVVFFSPKESLAKLSLAASLQNAICYVYVRYGNAEKDAKSYVSLWKREEFQVGPFSSRGPLAVDRYSGLKIKSLCVAWQSTIAISDPIQVFWTILGLWTTTEDRTTIGYHILRGRWIVHGMN